MASSASCSHWTPWGKGALIPLPFLSTTATMGQLRPALVWSLVSLSWSVKVDQDLVCHLTCHWTCSPRGLICSPVSISFCPPPHFLYPPAPFHSLCSFTCSSMTFVTPASPPVAQQHSIGAVSSTLTPSQHRIELLVLPISCDLMEIY